MSNTATVTTKGQIVIPSEIRKKHKIKKGTKLLVKENGEEIILRPITEAYFEKMAGVLKTKGKLSKALLKERSKDKAKER